MDPLESRSEFDAADATLRRLARACLHDAHEVEDVVQDAWVTRLKRESDPPEPLIWLRGVTRNLARDRRRQQLNRAARELDHDAPQPERSPLDVAAALEIGRTLRAAVDELPKHLSTPMCLHFYEDLSYPEIARRLARPESTVKTQVREGLDRLQRKLDSHYGSRGQWQLALAPFLGTPRRQVAVAAGGSAVYTWWKSLAVLAVLASGAWVAWPDRLVLAFPSPRPFHAPAAWWRHCRMSKSMDVGGAPARFLR